MAPTACGLSVRKSSNQLPRTTDLSVSRQAVNPQVCAPHAGCGQTHRQVNRAVRCFPCWCVLCFKACKEVIEIVQQRDVTVTGHIVNLDLPCQPQLLVSTGGDGSGVGDIISIDSGK